MNENEQKPVPTSPSEAKDQSVPKIDFGIDEKPNTAPSSAQGKDKGSEKDSGSDTKPQQEKDGAPAKDSQSSQSAESTKDAEAKRDTEAKKNDEQKRNAEPKKNTGPGNEDEFNKKLSNLEERFEQQLTVNRKLAAMLEEQLDLLLSARRSMLAIQKTLESSAASKKKLEKALESVKNDDEGLPDIHWINRVRGTLAMLRRSGMV